MEWKNITPAERAPSNVYKSNDEAPVSLGSLLLDKLGIALASVCAIHCLLLPAVMMAMPWLESLLPHNIFHQVVLGVTLPLAALALIHGFMRHKSFIPGLWAISGVILLTLGITAHDNLLVERIFSIGGSFILLLGHWQNIRKCRCHTHAH